ncbi:MAG: SIS domain-containing protein [Bacteroidales bacterium]|nr:SIS domain-containing protein [Bacteroidales bacterium]
MDFANYSKYINYALEEINFKEIDNLISLILKAYENENTIFLIGNGGSAANASHFAEDLSKGTILNIQQKKRIKALSLTDNTPFMTALGNDNGFEMIFEQQIRTFAKKGDYLIAISGSGNSKNIIKAIEWANENNIVTIGITGFDGGILKKINRHNIHVPLNDMCSVESIHSVIFHFVILKLNETFQNK